MTITGKPWLCLKLHFRFYYLLNLQKNVQSHLDNRFSIVLSHIKTSIPPTTTPPTRIMRRMINPTIRRSQKPLDGTLLRKHHSRTHIMQRGSGTHFRWQYTQNHDEYHEELKSFLFHGHHFYDKFSTYLWTPFTLRGHISGFDIHFGDKVELGRRPRRHIIVLLIWW